VCDVRILWSRSSLIGRARGDRNSFPCSQIKHLNFEVPDDLPHHALQSLEQGMWCATFDHRHISEIPQSRDNVMQPRRERRRSLRTSYFLGEVVRYFISYKNLEVFGPSKYCTVGFLRGRRGATLGRCV
jgi:hypothetical protein